jgi:hypothetical protein
MPRCFEYLSKTFLVSLLVANVGCFQKENFVFTDDDGDGFALEFGDCDDTNANVNPDENEDCNNLDDNCDGVTDEGFDDDDDNFTECDQPVADCNDNNDQVFPGAIEINDGLDNDCNGSIDDAQLDNDGDGFCEDPNICNDNSQPGDCHDIQEVVNPAAIEFEGDNVDNNCDGQIDEPFVACDGGNLSNNVPGDFAKALDFCFDEVEAAQFLGGNGSGQGRAIVGSFGNAPFVDGLNVPANGAKMIHLSSGAANTGDHDLGVAHDGALGGNCIVNNHPNPQGDPGACGDADPAQVCDLTGLNLNIRVPSNAQSLSFDFQFFSSEYRTFRCSQFDDTFVAFLTSQNFIGNISFDANNAVVSVNNGFFEICIDDLNNVNGGPPNDCVVDNDFSSLSGTGYNVNGDPQGNSDSAGATRSLTTTVGVVPGELINLKIQIFDEGDDLLDSSAIIDNFRWDLQPAEEPVTIE